MLSPAHNATGVALNANLVMTFNENIKFGTGTFTIKKVSDNSIVTTGLSGDAWLTVSGTTLTFNPLLDFEGLTAYYAEVSNGLVQDIVGNNYVGFVGNGTWRFTTGADLTAPTAVTYSPANGSTNIALNSNLVVTFNENVKKGTGNITIRKMSDNTPVETIAVTDGTVNISGAVVTINPANDLPANTTYYVEIASGAIQDMANNNFAGITGNNTWNFTSLDNIAPTLSSFSPAHNAVEVSVSANLVMTFSENVKKGTSGAIYLKQVSNNATVATFDVTNSNFTINGAVATINPADFGFFTELYVEVDNGVIQDLAGNNFAGFTGSTTWKFKTVNETTPPTVLTFNPANNTQSFAGANNLTITFNENVQKGTAGNIVIKKLSDNSVFESIAITDTKISVSGAVVTINPANDLTFNTEFYVEVASGAIKDLADNNFAGFVGNNTWKFKTDFSTAIEDNLVGKAITVYPNPTDRFATLLVKQGISFKNVRLRLIDMAGKAVWETHTKQLAEKQTFDWDSLPAGKYFLEIQSEQGTALKAVIKQ
jgi:methionine-rich copper-binding protein CopC